MKERKRVQKFFEKPSRTKQCFKEQCDLGKTLKRFARTEDGRLAISELQGFTADMRFEDVSAVPDFRSARDIVNAAEAKFMALPAIVRRRFDNDAAQFLDFATNPENLSELRSMGLAKPEASVLTEESLGHLSIT